MENQNMTETATEQQEKTFTQEQLNAIVGKRLAEQKQQMEADLVKREQELDKREMSIRAKELLAEKGLPKDLAAVLRYETEEELVKAIDMIEHTKGFKNENEGEKVNGLPSGLRVLGDNRLPERGKEDDIIDPIAAAFRRKDE